MRGPECSTDHYLLGSQFRLKITFARRRAPCSAKPKQINISIKLQVPRYCEELSCLITSTMQDMPNGQEEDVEVRWKVLKVAVYAVSKEVLGHPQSGIPI